MWIILGVIAIITTGINLYMYGTGKDNKLARPFFGGKFR